jgi:YfiH family protein
MARELFTGNSGDLFENAKALCEVTSLTKLAFMKQVHGNEILQVHSDGLIPECDALITTEKSIGLVVASADCLPVLFTSKNVVAAAHAGRKGLIANILGRTVSAMKELGAKDIKASIGPSICVRCYEVSPEMYLELGNSMPGIGDLAGHLNLKTAARLELESVGVEVKDVDICTKESKNYFSYRRDATPFRQYGVVAL